MSVVRHMFGTFGTPNLMVAIIFMFRPRKGQCQVKLGKIRSNFQIQNLLTKTRLSCPNLSQDSKTLLFLRTIIKNAKNCFSKK